MTVCVAPTRFFSLLALSDADNDAINLDFIEMGWFTHERFWKDLYVPFWTSEKLSQIANAKE